jgi:hypothetical protein
MTIGINEFKSKLTGGGARSNMFKVTCNFPAFAGGSSELASFMISKTNLPGSDVAALELGFRGRKLKLPGERKFEPWTVTVINDVDMSIRNAFERWMNAISKHQANTGLSNTNDYMVDMAVEQLDRAGKSVKKYDFRGVWPSKVASIELGNDSEAIEEFAVELQYQYWQSNTTD